MKKINNPEKGQNNFKVVRGAFLLVSLFLVCYLFAVAIGAKDFFVESAEKNAEITVEEDLARANALVAEHFDRLYDIVERLEFAKSREDVETVIESYIGSDDFGGLRYYSQGTSYAANGALVDEESSGYEYIEALSSAGIAGSSPVYYDKYTELDCIAFFVPVRGSEHVDGILSILPARNVINVGDVINDKASVVAVIDQSGKCLSGTVKEGFIENVGNNFYEFIDRFAANKTDAVRIAEAALKKEKTAVSIATPSGDYTIAIVPISGFDNHLLLVSMSESEGLIAPELTYIRHIINLLVIAIVALIVGFVYAALYHKRTKLELAVAALVDHSLDCSNAEGFRLRMKDLILLRKRKYSVISILIRNFIYINEQLGENDSLEMLRGFSNILESLCTKEECYGYAGDGKFLILTINANTHSVRDKIRLIEAIINRNTLLVERGIKLRFAAGVYNVAAANRRTVQEMIDCANTACMYSEDNPNELFSTFTEEVKLEIERNEKIEAMMETSLASREFRLFLQPKYDAVHDCVHSAEALVRWFDPSKGDYRFPADFIPLFETNGFIVKLDHFVYIEVLEYLSGAAERGEKVVPIAVNVSRVTATSPDFINFYVGNKKKYGIPDGFITLELTESFAMEDYGTISTIISALHNGGMRLSIDDFGSGYSSFSILKQVNVDELKLDSVFMKRGIDLSRDDKLHATMIDLAKFMGMSVVQEGVETKELFDKVIAMGCTVIQGFYYAKALPLEEFRLFVSSNTSIRYKSLVK